MPKPQVSQDTLWPLIEANAACVADVKLNPTHQTALAYAALARSNLQDALAGADRPGDLPPVEGDLLPAIGAKVLIHLASSDAWVEHEVVGYYVWGDLGRDPRLQRVNIRVMDAQGCLNARMLADIRHPDGTPYVKSADCEPRPERQRG